MSWANLMMKFLRLGPIGLGVIAVAILGLGYFLQLKSNELDATKAAALAAGPPDAVNIAAFDGLVAESRPTHKDKAISFKPVIQDIKPPPCWLL